MGLLAKLWKAIQGCELSFLSIPWENWVAEAPICALPVPRVRFLSHII